MKYDYAKEAEKAKDRGQTEFEFVRRLISCWEIELENLFNWQDHRHTIADLLGCEESFVAITARIRTMLSKDSGRTEP